MSPVILAMLAMTGRVTMLGLARWVGKGGSYRTIQSFYGTNIPWAQVFWQFFRQRLLRKEEVYILVGDESVIRKAGKRSRVIKNTQDQCAEPASGWRNRGFS